MPCLTYEIKGDKIILCKEGTFFGLNIDQYVELKELIEEVDAIMFLKLLEKIYGNEVETD
jgi:hypothetical protein